MSEPSDSLADIIRHLGPVSIAVSGGVDSMTLATLAHRVDPPGGATMVHAVSPAVPPEATARVREWAALEEWRLSVPDAGEFDDPDYRRNPVDRRPDLQTEPRFGDRGTNRRDDRLGDQLR